MRTWRISVACIGLLLAAACGDSSSPIPGERPASLRLINKSQFFLAELRLHDDLEYGTAANRMPEGMTIDQELLLHLQGAWYVTVFRERYRDGPTIALTTGEPIALAPERGYSLTIFDESFRLSDDRYVPPPPAPGTTTSTAAGS
ncbi:MAG: hypothetical protein IT384_23900 [Deltaproteobacteria bacterium]|nr:hypothetical protein [Deltaproteobacteria bacterium]